MKKTLLSLLLSTLVLSGCDTLPLNTWYEDIMGREDSTPVAAADQEVEDEGLLDVVDAIDFRKIHWNDHNIGDWPVEDEPFGVSVDSRHIRWTFDQSHWPVKGGVNGNIFFIWEENGRLYGESFEHIRNKAKQIGANEVKGGGKLRSKPDSWRPTKGEKYWLVMASHVRGWKKIQRRTNIEKIRWKR